MTAFFDFLNALSTWLVQAFSAIVPVYWSDASGLTILGVLLASLMGFAVCSILVWVCFKFLLFRG